MARYRNMRSKRQCSLCLQFALILGAGPVLHRPTSLVIHRLEWNRTRFYLCNSNQSLFTDFLYIYILVTLV